MVNVIESDKLTKYFGEQVTVDQLSISVPQGSVFGFLGPNGAGKTTTLRILVGLAKPSSGDAIVLGESILEARRHYLNRIGYLPDVPGFYNWMCPAEFLTLVGEVFGMEQGTLKLRVAEMLDLAKLSVVKTRIGGFSRGMKQRLGLAQALLNRPDLLFLDEPTSDLDPIGHREILDVIASLKGKITVFFSTHSFFNRFPTIFPDRYRVWKPV